MAITIAEKVLIVGGVLNLAYGTLLGYPITVIRAKGAPATPRYLMATHISTLLHAAVLLGLAWAARLSGLARCSRLAARHLLRADCREGHLELAHWCAGRVRRKGQDRPAGRARRAGGNSWCRHLRRRHPHSAVTSGVNALVSLAHIGRSGRFWRRVVCAAYRLTGSASRRLDSSVTASPIIR